MHKVSRLLTRIVGEPLLIADNKLQTILDLVAIPILIGDKEAVDKTPNMSWRTQKDGRTALNPRDTSIGVINVFDSLVSKNASAASGMTSYESISKQMRGLVQDGVQEIGFYLDTPGGEAKGLFALTAEIRALREQGITTWAFTDGLATSAGYAIGAACQYFYASSTAMVASIGAIMVHVDLSAQDAATGKKYTFFRSKAEKALGDSHTALDETVIKKFTESLAYLDNEFNNDVLLGRSNINLKTILDLKGSEIYATKALELGLIDAIATNIDEAIGFVRKSGGVTMSTTTGGLMDFEAMSAALKAEQEKTAALEATINQLQVDAVAAVATAKAEMLDLFQTADTLRIGAALNVTEFLKEHLEAGFSSEQSKLLMKQMAKGFSPSLDSSGGLHESFVDPKTEGSGNKAGALRDAYQKATNKLKA